MPTRNRFDDIAPETYSTVRRILDTYPNRSALNISDETGVPYYFVRRMRDGDVPKAANGNGHVYGGPVNGSVSTGVASDAELSCYEYEFAGKKREIWGCSPKMLDVFSEIDKASRDGDIPILIIGESGTGKDLVAGAIHAKGPRMGGPYVDASCGAFNEGVLESELFGHVRGSFTGAFSNRKGVFALADKGTLFLDEVDAASMGTQAKLLKAVEYGQIRPVGYDGVESIEVNTRVIAATSRDLAALRSRGKFRADLFYRLNAYSIYLPSLGERGKQEIFLLAKHFLKKYTESMGIQKQLTDDALGELASYRWPGNVRQLQNIIRGAAIQTGDRVEIGLDDIKKLLSPRKALHTGRGHHDIDLDEIMEVIMERRLTAEELEAEYIITAARVLGGIDTFGVKTRMADLLGIPARTLRDKIKKLGLGSNADDAP